MEETIEILKNLKDSYENFHKVSYEDGVIETITANASHVSNLTTVAGCDSIVTTNVTMLPTYSSNIPTSICAGENYTFPDGTIHLNVMSNESYSSIFSSVNGCDSIIITDIVVNELPIIDAGSSTSLCDGESITLTANNPNGAPIAMRSLRRHRLHLFFNFE